MRFRIRSGGAPLQGPNEVEAGKEDILAQDGEYTSGKSDRLVASRLLVWLCR